MKYFKRLKLYKATNVTFSPETMDAFSYRWWRFVGIVEGKLIFNNFRYSVTTAKHQRQLRSLLAELGIKVDIEMPLPRGIRHDQTLAELIQESEEHLCAEVLEAELKREERNAKARQRRQLAKEAAEMAICAASHESQEVHTAAVMQFKAGGRHE